MSDLSIAPTLSKSASLNLEVVEGRPTTTSLAVAERFGKLHKNVIKAIKGLECTPDFHKLNFEPMEIEVQIGMGKARKDPAYRMTRDGFTFLCMGFTGKEAAKWKEAYINAFNQMEQELLKCQEPALLADPAMVTHRHAFNGYSVDFVVSDGQVWVAASHICNALRLHSSDRITRSLPATRKRRVPRGHGKGLWMVDAQAAMRAADYCSTNHANDYRSWLAVVLAEIEGLPAPQTGRLLYAPERTQAEERALAALEGARFVCWRDSGRWQLQELPPGTVGMQPSQMADWFRDPAGAPREVLPDVLQAIAERLSGRHTLN